VHPGESISSYAMKGVIDFLMNKEDLRAKLLRKMFVFMIIPMINVDGVYHGYFRMDS
jgi:murein tripeptide amidase MpaA